MRISLTTTAALAAGTALVLALTSCGTDSDPGSGTGAADGSGALTVAASPVPHAEILEYVRDHLAEDAGLDLDVKVFNDYVLPNTATESGEVDANFFQHQPYLDDFNDKNGTRLTPVAEVHLEPLGLYSASLEDAGDIPRGGTVAVPSDTTNEGRALKLLADRGVIELADGVGANGTLDDIADRKGLEFEELEAATVPRALDEVDAAVINGNYAIEADLEPADDALAIEGAEDNPYANLLAVKEGHEQDPDVRTLARLLTSEEVSAFIEDEYDGSVVPASGTTAP